MPDEKPPLETPTSPSPAASAAPPPSSANPAEEARKKLYEDKDEFRFQWYMERRKGYSSGARESYSRYDQTIAAVSASAIVLSINFVKDIGHEQTSIPWLLGSWMLLLVAGGTSLISLRTSADCDLANMTALECLRQGRDYKKLEESAQRLGKRTELLNSIAIRTMLGGIFLMMVFAVWNVMTLGESECPPLERVVREGLVPGRTPGQKGPIPPAGTAPAPLQADPAMSTTVAPAKQPSASKRKGSPQNP
jgi:hypothetical protein